MLERGILLFPQRLSSQKAVKANIEIPTRIERTPTDILKVLSSTIQRDYNAAHYKYQDDPFLTPSSNTSKRIYALSKESGRKAARYFLDKYPALFYRDDAEPKIPMFSYSDSFKERTVVDETDLRNCINCRQVANAVQVYQNCRQQKVQLSQQILESLLELLCFFNSNEGPDTEFLEQIWYKQNDERQDTRKSWQENSVAEEVFESLPEKTPSSVGSFICGLGKYNAADKALKVYEDARGNNMLLPTETYNHLIKMVSFLRGSGDSRWELILDILRDMSITNTKPNVETLNEILGILTKLGTWKHCKNFAVKAVTEMKRLDVEPSLGTYSCLLSIFTNDRTGGASPEVLYEIMDEIEQKQIPICDAKDLTFFVNSMSVANESLCDIELAYRIHRYLSKGDNYKLVGDNFRESVYYQQLMKLICSSETMDGIREFYTKYVPGVYSPEPGVIGSIINAIELHEGYEFLPILWDDIIAAEFVTRDMVYKTLLKVMSSSKIKDPVVLDRLVCITKDFMHRMDVAVSEQKYGAAASSWCGETLSSIMRIFLNASDLPLATSVLKKLYDNQNSIVGFAETEVLQEYCLKMIESGDTENVLFCCRYASEVGNEFVLNFAADNIDKVTTEDDNMKKLSLLLQRGS